MSSLFALHDVILAALPLRDTSEPTKPDTVSVNVIVASNAPFCVPDGTEMLTPGAVVSTLTVTFFEVAAVFWLFAASVATLAATPIVTVPLAVSAIVSDRPTQYENLKRLIADAVKRLEQSKWADASGLAVGQGFGFFRRYLRLAGATAWLSIDYEAVKQTPEKMLELVFSDYQADPVRIKLEEVRSKLADVVEHKQIRDNKEVHLPIDLPINTDSVKTLNYIVAQLVRIANLVDPDGPTYR